MCNVHDYLETHRDHINYEHFKALGLPLGSGMVESACSDNTDTSCYWSYLAICFVLNSGPCVCSDVVDIKLATNLCLVPYISDRILPVGDITELCH